MIKDYIELIKKNLNETEDQLLNMAFQLTGNLMDAKKLLEQTKERLLTTTSINHDNIINFSWWIFKEMKNIHIQEYLIDAEHSMLMDSTNDCYLVLDNNEIISVNDSVGMMHKKLVNPFKMYVEGHDIDTICDKLNKEEQHVREKITLAQRKIERALLSVIERYKPKFIIIWNFKVFEHIDRENLNVEKYILPDDTSIETRFFNHEDGTITRIFPIKYHKAGLSPVFWHKAILSFMNKSKA